MVLPPGPAGLKFWTFPSLTANSVADSGLAILSCEGGTYNLSGQPAVLGYGYLITGFAAALKLGHVAEAGSYTLTGSAAALLTGHVAAAGAYTLTGSAAALLTGHTAAAGSYTLTGSTASFVVAAGNITLSAAAGSYAVTGSSAGEAFRLTADGALGTAGGSPMGLLLALMGGGVGAGYTVTGSSAGFVATGPVLFAAGAGAYTLTGSAATVGGAIVGYLVTGSTAGFKFGDVAAAGAYTLTGFPAALTVSGNLVLSAAAGSYALTGASAALALGFGSAAGAYTLTGSAATLATRVTAGAGSYVLTGSDAAFALTAGNTTLICASGAYTLTGADATFQISGIAPPEVIAPSPGGAGARSGRPLYRRLKLKKKTVLEELEELLRELPPLGTAEAAPLPRQGIDALMPLSQATTSLLDSVAAPPILPALRAVIDDEDDDEVALLLELLL